MLNRYTIGDPMLSDNEEVYLASDIERLRVEGRERVIEVISDAFDKLMGSPYPVGVLETADRILAALFDDGPAKRKE